MNYIIITLEDGTKAIQMPGPTITLDTLNGQHSGIEVQINMKTSDVVSDKVQLTQDENILADLQSQLAV